MSEKQEGEDPTHPEKAVESLEEGVSGLLSGIYHGILGFSDWTKNQHIVVQSAITALVAYGIGQILGVIYATFWGQAAPISGIILGLMPVPLSLVIYLMILAIIVLSWVVYDLRSELKEMKNES